MVRFVVKVLLILTVSDKCGQICCKGVVNINCE